MNVDFEKNVGWSIIHTIQIFLHSKLGHIKARNLVINSFGLLWLGNFTNRLSRFETTVLGIVFQIKMKLGEHWRGKFKCTKSNCQIRFVVKLNGECKLCPKNSFPLVLFFCFCYERLANLLWNHSVVGISPTLSPRQWSACLSPCTSKEASPVYVLVTVLQSSYYLIVIKNCVYKSCIMCISPDLETNISN